MKRLVVTLFPCRHGSVRPHIDLPLARSYPNGKLMLDELIDEKIGLGEINKGFDKMQHGALIRSVVDDPGYADEIESHSEMLDDWIESTGDFIPSFCATDDFYRKTRENTSANISQHVYRRKDSKIITR